MSNSHYYDKEDLKNFPKIKDLATNLGNSFFDYYTQSTSKGLLSEREKTLIALVVSHTEKCPYCIDAYTNKSISLGITPDEMMEAVHVGASMQAGITLAQATQMQKIINKKMMT